ncbi:MAG: ATP-binding protein [Saccharothrix sp.]|nr:ATP-binding protein [Saccharothrix sp.]
MTKRYSYADAVNLLGRGEPKLLRALDGLVGGALLGGVAIGALDLLSWFDAKAEFVRLAGDLLSKVSARARGAGRRDRTDLLHAAHAVVVVVAFFDAVGTCVAPLRLAKLGIDKARQRELLRLGGLFDGTWPLPTADRTYGDNLSLLSEAYRTAAGSLIVVIKASEAWAKLDPDDQSTLSLKLFDLSATAVDRYEELVKRLAGDFPELAFWLQFEHERVVEASLARVEADLSAMTRGHDAGVRRAELSARHRAVLDRPILDADDLPAGLRLPPTGDAYVDPDFQVVSMAPDARPEELGWWSERRVRTDLHRFLVGHLTAPDATARPLVVLGDPGSGKSLLTKVLASRLPAEDFVVVRVELRTAPAEDDVLNQVEHGIRAALHEPVSLAELCRTSGEALPVIMLDGFDELLQVSGVSHTDYLVKVERLQRECAEAGRPIAVIVTSRIGVAARMRVPHGAIVLRLAPFTEDQVRRWVDVWNAANTSHFAEQDREPLSAESVLAHPDLAGQPLLLLMLALYDSTDNTLRRDLRLARAVLYERLLVGFARREVAKDRVGDLTAEVDAELDRLSVVAFAMLHRGALWASEADLDADLAALLDLHRPAQRGLRAPLGPGGAVLGRFFFIQRAEARNDETTLRTYEFLHATFGEYLVARFTWRSLLEVSRVDSARLSRHAATHLEDSELHAVLSFTPLTERRTVLDFLAELAAASAERADLLDLVGRLLLVADDARPRRLGRYQPTPRTVPARHAIYGVNLVLLGVVLAEALDVADVYIEDWPRVTAFWKSQLAAEEWESLVKSLRVDLRPGRRVVLALGRGTPTRLSPDVLDLDVSLADATLEATFTTDPATNALRYPLEALPSTHLTLDYARALVELNVSPVPPAERAARYLRWAEVFPDLVLDRLRHDVLVGVDTLRALLDTAVGRAPGFVSALCEKLGHGGHDAELLDLIAATGDLPVANEVQLLDAWLRLHEKGAEFGGHPGLVAVLRQLDIERIERLRPDLIKRAVAAVKELEEEEE